MMIDQMIMEARSMGCSDIHITVGMPLMYRINGRLQNAQTNPSDGEIIAMLAELLTDEQRENLERGIDADFAIRTPDGNRQRVNVFKQDGKMAAIIRLLNSSIPSMEMLGLPSVLRELADKPRGMILVTGPTGSGKSTTLASMIDYINENRPQMIPLLYDTTTGQVRVGGKDVSDYDIESLRDQVSVVLQKNVLFSGTIKENLRWGNPNASDEELVAACKLAQADEFVRSFPDGYDTYIEQGGTNVSGGQKQRLCIARALLKKPKILILDDSTSAVDTKTDALIRKAFREEIPDTTKIIIAQRISSIEDADRVIVLDDGRIDAFDTPQQLLKTNKIYQEVYQSQVKGAKEE